MTIKELEKTLLKLDVRSRARLAGKLLQSLDELSDADNERLWAEEAFRRHQELCRGKAKARPAGKVFTEARASI